MNDKEWIIRIAIEQEKIKGLERQLETQKKVHEMEVLATKQECWNQAEKDKDDLIQKLVTDKTHQIEVWDIEDSNVVAGGRIMKGKFYRVKPIEK